MITILICLSQGSICRSGQTQARQAPDSAHPGRPRRPDRPLVARTTRPRVSGRAQGGEGIPTTDAMKRPCSANPSQASTATSQQAHASPSPRCAIASVFDESGAILCLTTGRGARRDMHTVSAGCSGDVTNWRENTARPCAWGHITFDLHGLDRSFTNAHAASMTNPPRCAPAGAPPR